MQDKKTLGHFFITAVLTWLWLDFIGLMLAVISTYFYFGWAGTPQLVNKIFGISMATFSGPVIFRILNIKVSAVRMVRSGLPVLLILYLLISFNRDSDFFAWTVVFCTWFSGILMIANLQLLNHFQYRSQAPLAIFYGFLCFLLARMFNHGLMTVFLINYFSIIILLVLSVLALFYFKPAPTDTPSTRPGLIIQLYGVVFGLLIGLSIGLFYNAYIWSSKTPGIPSSIYILSFGFAVVAAIYQPKKIDRMAYFTWLVLALLFSFIALYGLLNQELTFTKAFIFHYFGCLGLARLWMLTLQRFHFHLQSSSRLPILGLQIGFIGLLLILAIFLLKSNPNGFWLALAFSVLIGAITEFKISLPQSENHWSGLKMAIGVYAILSLFSLAYLDPVSKEPVNKGAPFEANRLKLMSSNIRYGWTDDYRYQPDKHLEYLKHKPVDIIGFQEVNKGHTSASYMDLFSYYRRGLAGYWIYGDANFGFGNALLSQLKVKKSYTRQYKDKDILRRSYIWALIDFEGQEIEVYNTHVSHLPHPNKVRQGQVQELLEQVKQSTRPWIVMGDFNSRPQDPEIQSILPLVHPIFRENDALLKEKSYPSLNPDFRIDYIFFSEEFELLKYAVLDNKQTSDHRPVYCELTLKK